MTKIWGLHRITGYWKPLRESELAEVAQWLEIFTKYQSDTYSEFKASKVRPKYKPSRFDSPRKVDVNLNGKMRKQNETT